MHIFLFFLTSLLYSSTCFEHCCAHHQEIKLYYRASGIVTLCRWPSGAQVERGLVLSQPALHQEVKLYYAASGIVTLCSWTSGAQVERGLVLSQPALHQEVKLYYRVSGIVTLCRWPSGAQVFCLSVQNNTTPSGETY